MATQTAAMIPARASRARVAAHSSAIRKLAESLKLSRPRLRGDGALIVHSDESGYHAVLRLSAMASEMVGEYVFVITDDVPGATGAQDL